jgi:peptidoglycan glycosyltransferase
LNKPIRKVSVAIGVLFVALFVNLNVVQVLQGNSYRDDPNNRRVLLNEYSNPRGQIVVSGSAIASSRKTSDELKYLRTYADGPVYAPVTGYYSFTYGTSGMEDAENGVLTGDDTRLFGTKLAGLLTGRDPKGGSVQLTINAAAQQAAFKALGGRRGAVVALDPQTGGILAAVSTPSWDPNQLSSHNADAISRAYHCYSPLNTVQGPNESDTAFKARMRTSIPAQLAEREKTCVDVPDDPTALYKADPYNEGPFLNRAFRQVYPAGSVFKVIDAAAALSLPTPITPTTRIPAPNSYWPLEPQRTSKCSSSGPCVENFNGETCDDGKTATLLLALAKSCNTAFSKLTVDRITGKTLASEAQKFGLDAPYPPGSAPDFCDPVAFMTPLSVCRSSPGSLADLASPDTLAQTAIGQHDVGITPLQAAMISAAVANNGTLMQPYLVDKELRPDVSVLKTTAPRQLSQVIDPTRDADLISMMEGVVNGGPGIKDNTGGQAAIDDPNVKVGGKTGTADHCSSNAKTCPPPHAWFTGFAMVKGVPKIAVAVIIEDGGVRGDEAAPGTTTGGLAAAPVAKRVIEAYLKSSGGS